MKKILLGCLIILLGTPSFSQTKSQLDVYAIAFYNLENLFDTEDDINNKGDDEFLPNGTYRWTKDKYEKKLDNIAKVLSRISREHCPAGPAIIGVSEIENKKVLEDLVKRPDLESMNLQIIHHESPDRRGIDVAMLYNPAQFQFTDYSAHKFEYVDSTFITRDQLLINGMLAGEPIHVIVNHWPSRYGSKSSILRESAAAVTKKIVDSLNVAENNQAKIFIMGDLNDDPTNNSVRLVLNAKKEQKDVKEKGLYNPMWKMYDMGIGSLAYQSKWSLFDQIIISYPLLGNDYSSLKYWKAEIFNKEFLITKEGKRKGYPLRTFSDNTFINGYSDHFPTIVYVVKRRLVD